MKLLHSVTIVFSYLLLTAFPAAAGDDHSAGGLYSSTNQLEVTAPIDGCCKIYVFADGQCVYIENARGPMWTCQAKEGESVMNPDREKIRISCIEMDDRLADLCKPLPTGCENEDNVWAGKACTLSAMRWDRGKCSDDPECPPKET